jgi:hypothetical protein
MAAAAFLCAGVVIGLASMDTSALDMSDAISAAVIGVLSLCLMMKEPARL